MRKVKVTVFGSVFSACERSAENSSQINKKEPTTIKNAPAPSVRVSGIPNMASDKMVEHTALISDLKIALSERLLSS